MRPDGVLLIAAGGAAGTLVRYLIAVRVDVASFPWHTLLVNVAGCALLAIVSRPGQPRTRQRVLGTGFSGGLTTFSTLSVEVVEMLDGGSVGTAAIYLSASVAAGLAAYVFVRALVASGDGPRRPEAP